MKMFPAGMMLDCLARRRDLACYSPSWFSLLCAFYGLDRAGSLCLRAGLFSPGAGLQPANLRPVCPRFTRLGNLTIKCRYARPKTPVFTPSTDTYGTRLRSAGWILLVLVCDISRQPLNLPVFKPDFVPG